MLEVVRGIYASRLAARLDVASGADKPGDLLHSDCDLPQLLLLNWISRLNGLYG